MTEAERTPSISLPIVGAAIVMLLVWVFAFSPDPQILAVIPGFLGLMMGLEHVRSTKQMLILGAIFGGLTIGLGYHWLAQTVQDFGQVPVVPSYLLTAFFGVIGTVHVFLFAFIYRAASRKGRRLHPLTCVALWVVCEALPIRLFPWMMGHGAVDCPPLLQQAEWGGVSGVSFVMLCLLFPVYEWARWALAPDGDRARVRAAGLTFAIGLAFFGWGQWRYHQVLEQDKAAEQTWRIGIVQPNVGAGDKRMAERKAGEAERINVRNLESLSEKAIQEGAELIVWPETAVTRSIPLLLPKFSAARTNNALSQSASNLREDRDVHYGFLQRIGQKHAFLMGMYERIPRTRGGLDDNPKDYDWRHNVAALRYPDGRDIKWSVYRKKYLIPFGEAMPLGLAEDRLPQRFSMKPGPDEQGPLELKGRRLVPFLCYEGILPDHVRKVAGEHRADVLVSLTNDSWFGDTWEPHQHLNFTRFRAVEHRAPLVRATNTGISAFVNSAGDVVRRLELYKAGTLVESVPLVDHGRTIYVRFGHLLAWMMAVFALVGLALNARDTAA